LNPIFWEAAFGVATWSVAAYVAICFVAPMRPKVGGISPVSSFSSPLLGTENWSGEIRPAFLRWKKEGA
jgi:hypothetical protein